MARQRHLMVTTYLARKWRSWIACYKGVDNEPVIIMQPQNEGRMMFSPERGSQYSGPVWQKHILMGGKCELPDFSGVIMYDPHGNVVAPAKRARLALPYWK